LERGREVALAAPASAASASNPSFLKSADSCRKKKEKNAKIGFLERKPCPLRGLKELLGKQNYD
jgi:hypothetical protein